MTTKDRTLRFITSKGLSVKKFEEMCGLSNGYINSMKSGYGNNKLSQVLSAFPELNREWLVYGEGEMIREKLYDTSTKQEASSEDKQTPDNSLIDYLQRKIEELEREKAELLQENAVLKYENRMLAPSKGESAGDVVPSLSANAG